MMGENELPDGWVWTTLDEIRIDMSKGIEPNKLPEHTFELYSVPSFDLKIPEITSGTNIGSNKQTVETNTVLFCKINPRINRVWTVGHFSDHTKIASTEWIPFFPLKEVIPSYLQYYLNLNSARDYFAANASGVGGSLMRITPRTIVNYPFPLAPLPEQQRIVAAIEQQFTRLDAGVAALKSAKTRLKRYRATVLKAAVEGKLTEAWRAEHPTSEPASQLLARILQERRAKWEADLQAKGKDPAKVKYVEPATPDVSGLPEGWCWTSLEAISNIQLGKMLSPKAYEKNLLQLPYLRNENVRWGSIDYKDVKEMGFKDSEIERYSLEPQDLMVCEGGEAGRCAVYTGKSRQFMYQKALHRLRVSERVINPYFIQFCMQHYVSAKIVIPRPSETTIQHLPLEKMKVLPIPLPPLDEQQQIVSEVERRLSIVSQLEALVEANLKRAERLRQSVLKEAFAGRLVPQDPDDEPAIVLLERIRQEREAAGNENKGRKQSKQQYTYGNKNGLREQDTFQEAYVGNRIVQEPEPLDESEIAQVALWSVD